MMRTLAHLGAALLAATCLTGAAHAATKLTIATVDNGDMIVMRKLATAFEAANPGIELNWVVLDENVLRQRVTTDIATKRGEFDVMTIGAYEAPIWAKQKWLTPFENLSAAYDADDILKPVRDLLSFEGKLYALPFYAESSMTFYNTELFKQAGLTMPEKPTYQQVAEFAAKIHAPDKGIYGACLRGLAGWGENVAYVTTVVNTFGGRWFDPEWNPTLNEPAWKDGVSFYVDLLGKYGPPNPKDNGFTQNLKLFSEGHCGMWIDATVAAGMLFNPASSKVADKTGLAPAPVASHPKGSNWMWSWALAVPTSSKNAEAARRFIEWATSKEYISLVAEKEGWVAVPPGTRASTYAHPEYQAAAPFAPKVLDAIKSADPVDTTAKPKAYNGVQYVGIPEFQALGTRVGQLISSALDGKTTVDAALAEAQTTAERIMKQAGYRK
jgi:sorbitol/mannitol transport system substrate-binding protein